MILLKNKIQSMSNIKSVLQQFPGDGRENLIPILQAVQKQEGYISEETMIEISNYLKIPTSKVYAVSTFYDNFRFSPGAKHNITICNGTTCHMKGASAILSDIERKLNITPGKITKNRLYGLEAVPCMGACGMAPVLKIDSNFIPDATVEKVNDIIKTINRKEAI
jgi:NADH:ubiquinone oxidoreductase subunit E